MEDKTILLLIISAVISSFGGFSVKVFFDWIKQGKTNGILKREEFEIRISEIFKKLDIILDRVQESQGRIIALEKESEIRQPQITDIFDRLKDVEKIVERRRMNEA